jgi:hypothetical protein
MAGAYGEAQAPCDPDGPQCRLSRTKSLSAIISSPSAIASDVMSSSCLPHSLDARPAVHPWAASSTTATTRPALAATRVEAPTSRAITTASSGAKDALTIGQVAVSAPRMCPRRQVTVFHLPAQQLGVLLGEPVHEQRDHDRGHGHRGGLRLP